jgi:hypothetical protein
VQANIEIVSEMRNTYTILTGKPEGKKPFGIYRYVILGKVILKWILNN